MEATSGKISLNTLLLICGILYSLLYVGTDILAGLSYPGYSFLDQSISEESAIGAPTRYFTVPVLLIDTLILLAFGFGVWRSASQNRALRIIGYLLIGIGVIGLVWTLFPLHLGEPANSSANTLHTMFAGIQVSLILVTLGFGAAAFRTWFRFYSIGTILVLLGAGIAAFGMATTNPIEPPFFGVIERIDVYGYLLWVLVLAIVLLRAGRNQDTVHSSK